MAVSEQMFEQLAEALGIEDLDEHDVKFSQNELNTFFGSPIWKEIEKILMIQNKMLLSTLLKYDNPRDLDQAAKGFISSNHFILNIKSVLEGEDKEE